MNEHPIYKICQFRRGGYVQCEYQPFMYSELPDAIEAARALAAQFGWCAEYRVEAWYGSRAERVEIVWNSLQERAT